MLNIANWPIGAILCLLPVALMIAMIRRDKLQRKPKQHPFKELQRRPAGEALRLKIEKLDEKINEEIVWLLLIPILLSVVLFLQPKTHWTAVLVFFGIASITSMLFGTRLLKKSKERANHYLGFEGERFVGEELSRLIAFGFNIYHDVLFDNFNIDHVLVGTRGVFVVETKTRRKPSKETGKASAKVQFNGKSLQWPNWTESKSLEQVKGNAKKLNQWLNLATGENIWVTPILTIPGWWVERLVPIDGVYVLSAKEIFDVCSSMPEKLPAVQVQQLCAQLDKKCRIEMN